MKVYQLWVRGPRVSWFGESTFFSREVFLSQEAALAHLPEMDQRCRGLNPNDVTEVTAHGVLELDLVGAEDMTGILDQVRSVNEKLDVALHRVAYGTPGITTSGD